METMLDFCPLCWKHLHDKFRTTRWIHDILNNKDYFEMQIENTSNTTIRNMLYEVIEYHHKPDEQIESDNN